MSGGKLITTGSIFYRRGIPNSYTSFGVLTTINYTVANHKQNYIYNKTFTQYGNNYNLTNKK